MIPRSSSFAVVSISPRRRLAALKNPSAGRKEPQPNTHQNTPQKAEQPNPPQPPPPPPLPLRRSLGVLAGCDRCPLLEGSGGAAYDKVLSEADGSPGPYS